MKRNKFAVLTLMFLLPCLMGAKFTKEKCEKYNLGERWYCQEEERADQDHLPSAHEIMKAPISDIEKGMMLRELEALQRMKAAVSEKKQDKIKWLETNYLLADKGIGFANDIRRIVETNPKFQLRHNSRYASDVHREIEKEDVKQTLTRAVNRYGVVFVYSTTCSICSRQLPVLLRLKKNWGFKILGITLSGKAYPGLDEQMADPKILHDTSVFPKDDKPSIPRILLLDTRRAKKIFISKNLVELEELEQLMVNQIKRNENEKKQ